MSTTIQRLEQEQLKAVPGFRPGDRVRVHFQVVEGTRRRTQVFEGVVIKRQGHGVRETFTVRKQSFGVGVERTFPLHSPKIEKIEIAARGEVRRAKLYYLRDRIGKAARVRERRGTAAELAADEAALAAVAEQAQAAEASSEEAEADAVVEAEVEATEVVEEVAEVEEAVADEQVAEAEASVDEAAAAEPTAEAEPEASSDEADQATDAEADDKE